VLITCRTVTVNHHARHQCTARQLSAPVTFTTAVARATVSRGRTVYATGTSASLTRGRSRLMLTVRRRLRPGRYTLTLKARHGKRWVTSRTTITIG
jgi:hypothetical protein